MNLRACRAQNSGSDREFAAEAWKIGLFAADRRLTGCEKCPQRRHRQIHSWSRMTYLRIVIPLYLFV
jgi:transposase